MTIETHPLASDAAIPATNRDSSDRVTVLWLSFVGFALLFAAWTMFGVLGVPIRTEFGLSDIQLSWLTAIAILNGSLWRLPLGILADRSGGRLVFLGTLAASSAAAFAVSRAQTYPQLMVCAFCVGIAGNSFSVGSAWNAAWFPKSQHGFAMGLFGAGNVGASVTKLIGPSLIALVPAAGLANGWIPGGWRFVPMLYSALILIMAIIMWRMAPIPDRKPSAGRGFIAMHRPLKEIRVWRFGLYYTVVFGAYVALSVWLPKYYVDVYGLPLKQAALLTTPFIFASSLLRPFGGWLSDRFGARRVTYCVFISATVWAAMLLRPMSIVPFTAIVILMGISQGIGKASTIKYIPEYYPRDVGVVVGLVGAFAAIGGFAMPPLFAYLKAWTGVPQSMFGVLLVLSVTSLIWLHIVVTWIHRHEQHAI